MLTMHMCWAVPLNSDLHQQVREALTTSALLQLPRSMSRCAKEDRVQAVLVELVRSFLSKLLLQFPFALSKICVIDCWWCEQDLVGCANTMIGDETLGMKGISGGQRRRVGIGLELVKDPRLVFLDEVNHLPRRPAHAQDTNLV